jgi:hypothetical protein
MKEEAMKTNADMGGENTALFRAVKTPMASKDQSCERHLE